MLLFCISLQRTFIFLVASGALQSWTVLQGKLTRPAGVTQTCGWLFLLLLSTYVPPLGPFGCGPLLSDLLLSAWSSTSPIHLHHHLHSPSPSPLLAWSEEQRKEHRYRWHLTFALNQTFNTITSISIQMASLVAKIKVTSRNNCQWLFCIFCPRPMMRKGTNRFNDQGWWSQRCSYYIPYTIFQRCSYFYFYKGAHNSALPQQSVLCW